MIHLNVWSVLRLDDTVRWWNKTNREWDYSAGEREEHKPDGATV